MLVDPTPSVACLGETMVSLAPEPGTALAQSAHLTMDVAGAESNVAMYLAAHGVRSRWISRLGDDPFGRRVLDRVSSAGVDVSGVEIDRHRRTGLLFKDPDPDGGTRVHYYRRESAASAMTEELLQIPGVRGATVLHLTGITAALSPSCADLVRAALGPGSGRARTVSFDVNYRESLWRSDPGPELADLANRADIVFVGLDEAARLWSSCGDPDSVRTLIGRPRILVVKDGARGATAYVGTVATYVPAVRVRVVEEVGAGDAFAAGFLAGLLRDEAPKTALRRAHLTAASALRTTADFGPLVTDSVMHELLVAGEDAWSTVEIGGSS